MKLTNSRKQPPKKLMRWILQNNDLRHSQVLKPSSPAPQQPQKVESGSVILGETSGGITSPAHIAPSISNWSGSKSLGTTPRLKKESQTGSGLEAPRTTFANSVRVRFRIPTKLPRYDMESGFQRIKRAYQALGLIICRLCIHRIGNALGDISRSRSWRLKRP